MGLPLRAFFLRTRVGSDPVIARLLLMESSHSNKRPCVQEGNSASSSAAASTTVAGSADDVVAGATSASSIVDNNSMSVSRVPLSYLLDPIERLLHEAAAQEDQEAEDYLAGLLAEEQREQSGVDHDHHDDSHPPPHFDPRLKPAGADPLLVDIPASELHPPQRLLQPLYDNSRVTRLGLVLELLHWKVCIYMCLFEIIFPFFLSPLGE